MSKARQQANLSSDGNLFADISNDRVGIGSVVPTHKLHVAGTSKFDNDVTIADAKKLKIGNDGDVEFYFDGSSTSRIDSIGTGRDLEIRSDRFIKIAKKSNGAIGFQMLANDEVGLYHGGSKKINTTSTGAKVTGNLEVTGVLTYDDVTSIDSVGIVTARAGVHVTGGNLLVGTTTAGGWLAKVQVANNSSYQSAFNITNNVNADLQFDIKSSESR